MGNTALQEGPFKWIVYHEASRNGRGVVSEQLVGRGQAKTLTLVAAGGKLLVWAWVVFTRQITFDRSGCALIDSHPACRE
jgi:hypothetical protein